MSNRALEAAILTPAGRGAVASLRITGDDARRVVARLFRPASGRRFDDFPIDRIVFGRWAGEPGEELVVASRADGVVEVHCHGGQAAVTAIVESLREAGCAIVDGISPLDASLDALQREATIALTQAATWRTAAILLDQREGALSREMARLVAQLEQLTVGGESFRRLDDPDADRRKDSPPTIQSITTAIDALLARAPVGLHLVEPYKVVLAGEPNVGKSSLINALVGHERAIVFDQPGTTRDVVTVRTAIDGWPVELSDTAGLRTSADPLESAGIERARAQMQQADLVILVSDASRTDPPLAWPGALHVRNKCDLVTNPDSAADSLGVSAVTGHGIDRLLAEISRRLVPHPPQPGDAVPFTFEQIRALRRWLGTPMP